MQAVYKLWEASWEDGAILRDRQGRKFADADRIHRIVHKGPYFQLDAIHLCEPSPQRTPVLTRPARRRAAVNSRPSTRNAFSSTALQRRSFGDIVADIAAARRPAAATRHRS